MIFTPKSLLRLPERDVEAAATSRAAASERLIGDPLAAAAPERVERLILCSGKVYYDLRAERERRLRRSAAAAWRSRASSSCIRGPSRPSPRSCIASRARSSVVFAQEEPANMGAWTFVRERLQGALLPAQKLAYAGRRESASPAVGSVRIHKEQQAALLAAAFLGLG